MVDQSHLDKKYFIDESVYNCPFCNRNNVSYEFYRYFTFHWTEHQWCHVYLIRCKSCGKISMHLSFSDIRGKNTQGLRSLSFEGGIDIDSHLFYSVPTSFFVIDNRIPKVLRGLITEAEGCVKMNFLTGASACVRKAIYEFAVAEKAKGDHYEEQIKSLKEKFKDCDPQYFDILSQVQGMTSDKIHEQSWPSWDASHLKLFIETLKSIWYEVYVEPQIRRERAIQIQQLNSEIKTPKQDETANEAQDG